MKTTARSTSLPTRAKLLAVTVLLVLYGAVGARQPAVRASLPLPVPAAAIAAALELPEADTATLLLQITRVLYERPSGQDDEADKRRIALRQVLWTPGEKTTDKVPLPLDPSIWRDTILETKTPDHQLVAAITNDRRTALVYYGLASLDDETLAWLGADRRTLLHVRDEHGVFAAFGRSIRVHGGRVVVPGGPEAEPLWTSIVDAEPDEAGEFVRRVLASDGRLAFLYDTIAHLDPARQRFALGLHLPEKSRDDRLRALLEAFAKIGPEWRVNERPFLRPAVDGAILLSALAVNENGELQGPRGRRFWDHVFRGDEGFEIPFEEVGKGDIGPDDGATADAAWLASRILRVPPTLARRRLDTFLFGQRVLAEATALDLDTAATALRGAEAFPALALALERIGIREPATYVAAARHAAGLTAMRPAMARHASLLAFQSAVGIVVRAAQHGGLKPDAAGSLVRSLCAVDVAGEGYAGRLALWIQRGLAPALPGSPDAADPLEAAVLAGMAGLVPDRTLAEVDWEGRRYRVDPATAEMRRLRRVRQRQGGPTLDAALQGVAAATPGDRTASDPARALGDTLASILYAGHLGDPEGQAVTSGNVALRHDFGSTRAGPTDSEDTGSSTAWRLPAEDFTGSAGWRVRGSLLGLEAALGRLMLRRLDPAAMPGGPRFASADLQTLVLTAALMNPFAMTDGTRDEISAALGRGRARAAALTSDPMELDRAAKDAGLSEWRRQALAWAIEHDRARLVDRFGPLELFWLGAPRPASLASLGAWGAAMHPLSGRLCLEMPRPRPAEELTGRPTAGILATRYADLALQVADALAALGVPAPVAAGVFEFALQDVIDRCAPAYPDDPAAFGRAAAALSRDQYIDYIAALTAGGALVPLD